MPDTDFPEMRRSSSQTAERVTLLKIEMILAEPDVAGCSNSLFNILVYSDSHMGPSWS
jgi:hypothetical protein